MTKLIKPFTACFDIETTNLDPMFGILLCAVVKPWGAPDPDDIKLFVNHQQGADDREVVEATIEELNKYQVLIAHNGVFFDRKYLNGRALYHGCDLLNPRGKIIDPWRLAKNHLNFRGNSLDRISDFLGCREKKTVVDGEIWMRAGFERGYTQRGSDAMEYIKTHCLKDVAVLEEVADALMPFVGNIQSWGSA